MSDIVKLKTPEMYVESPWQHCIASKFRLWDRPLLHVKRMAASGGI